MRIQGFVRGLVCACFVCCTTARPQNACCADGPQYVPFPPKQLSSKQLAKVRLLKNRVERLDAQLDKNRRELNWLRGGDPNQARQNIAASTPSARVILLTGAYYGVNIGRKDGVLSTDRLVIVHRTEHSEKMNIVGMSTIDQLYDHDMMLVPEQDTGIRIEDEVYIINRDDTPHSLVYAKLK